MSQKNGTNGFGTMNSQHNGNGQSPVAKKTTNGEEVVLDTYEES